MQHRITRPSKLLNKQGELIQRGYATAPILIYRREDVKDRIQLKEWDYYLIYNNDFAAALTVGTSPLAGLISVSFIDFNNKQEKTRSKVIFPLKMNLPETSFEGDIIYKDLNTEVAFLHEWNTRKLYLSMEKFDGNTDFEAVITLSEEPSDSMVIATPFRENKKAFFYNQKITGMKASGRISYKGKSYLFLPMDSFGLLDWGRGVWPYKTTWYWSAAQGKINNNLFGFNFGYGFGDTSAATENMLFFNGNANKLEDVQFIIPKDKLNHYDYLKPWVITSSDNRVKLDFIPVLDRSVNLNTVMLSTNQHQVFGRFKGKVILDDCTAVELDDFPGFAEKVENRW